MRISFDRGGGRSAEDLLDDAGDELDRGDLTRGLRLLDRARAAAERAGSHEGVATALLMRAAALSDAGRYAEAERSARELLELSPEDAEGWDELADALYRQARFEEAEAALDRRLTLGDGDAEAWHLLGRVRIWRRDREGARDAFARAHRLAPDHHPVPVRIAPGEFDRLAHAAWAAVPAAFRARLRNTAVVVEELPGEDEVEEGLDPDVLGVYEGGTALEDDLPERIVLYQRNHETICATLGGLREEIGRTMLHEVGHHFGMDDHELPY